MFPATASPDPRTPPGGKRGFAKRARGFAKRVPGFPMLWIGSAAAFGIMVVTGGFGTVQMPLGTRALFWLVLMGWSALKWQFWFAATVRDSRDWIRAAAIGAVLLSLPLPLEIRLAAQAAGADAATPDPIGTWARALAIGAVLLATVLMVMRTLGYPVLGRRVSPAPAPANGILERTRTAPDTLAAIEAEDHYCRVRRRDGGSALVHYRFGDALADIAALDGARVHRGAWVAADAVERAERDGRRWRLHVAGGAALPVSATYVAEARRRGWLRGAS